jgi:hypothetical protein
LPPDNRPGEALARLAAASTKRRRVAHHDEQLSHGKSGHRKFLFVERAQLDDALRDSSIAMNDTEYVETLERDWGLREWIAVTPASPPAELTPKALALEPRMECDEEITNRGPGLAREPAKSLVADMLAMVST